MLTKLKRSDIPRPGSGEPSALRAFAERTAAEFVATTEPGEAAEVTGAPVEMDRAGVQRLAEALRYALFRMGERDMRREVRVITRGGERVFMERVERPRKQDAPARMQACGGKRKVTTF